MKAKLVMCFLLAFIISQLANSQSFYRLKYKSPDTNDTITYDAFFAIYDNGTGFVRISYLSPSAGMNSVAEMEIQEQYATDKEGRTDTANLVYEVLNSTIKKGDSTVPFRPVTFWFKKNAGNNFFEPWGVTASASDMMAGPGNFLSAEFLAVPALSADKETGLVFFSRQEDFYKNIWGTLSRGDILTAEQRKTKLFLLIVASTNDATIGNSCLMDGRKAIEMFDSIAGFLGIRKNMIVDTVYGNRYNKKNVDAAINKLNPSPRDIVIFYYSGHGYTNRKEPTKNFPFLDLRDPLQLKDPQLIKLKKTPKLSENTLNIEDIYEKVKAKKARFTLVLSDCCNDTIEAKNVKAPPPPRPPRPRGDVKFNPENVKALFMNKEQLSLLMTAASKNERATSNDTYGGFFTNNFLESMKACLGPNSRNANWARIMADAQRLTIFQAKRTYCPLPSNEKNVCHQTPLSPKIN